jgi:phenylacetate-CoA ligase
VVSSFSPATTGEIQIVLNQPGPAVPPPLKVVAEQSGDSSDSIRLKDDIERKIKATLSVAAEVTLVPAGTLPRFEMKGQLIRKTYETAAPVHQK